jgi:DNA-binding LacI/PurR family transcriptional regulator
MRNNKLEVSKMSTSDVKHELSPGKHLRIYETLAARITTGQYRPGQQIPTMDMLSQSFKASKPTIAKALDHLEQKGLISRKRGGGVFVHESVVPKQQTKSIGLLIPDLIAREEHHRTESIFASMVSHILTFSKERNFFLMADSYSVEVETILDDIKRSVDNFVNQNCAGVLFQFVTRNNSQALNDKVNDILEKSQLPVVLIDRDLCQFPNRSRFDLVGINNERAAYVLTTHLVNLGCKNLCYVKVDFDSNSPVNAERLAGFQNALIQNNLPPDNIISLSTDSDSDFAETLIRHLRRKKVDALVCVHDGIAIRCMKHMLLNGFRIPEDVKLVGFDDLPSSQMLPVPLTTICQPVAAIASEAVFALSDRINSPERPVREIMLSEKLIIRQSCGSKLII